MSKGGKKRYAFEPDYAVPPGETLLETIEALGMTQRDLAVRTGMAPKTINQIIKGKAPITPDTAILLERVTGVPTRMWNNLESNYREQLAQIADRQRLETDLEWLKKVPVNELVKRGVIEKIEDNVTKLRAVLKFFGVGNVEQWETCWMEPECSFRKSSKFESQPETVATWIRLGEIEAQSINTQPYNKQTFEAILPEIRKLTVESPKVFKSALVELAASSGIAVVFIPKMKKCPVSGVTHWLAPDKAIIQLSLRGKSDDLMWFTFFHEAAHILRDPKKRMYIHGETVDERDRNADRFSTDFLIPSSYRSTLPKLTTEAAISKFARKIGVSPGIVVGRLQHEGLIPYNSPFNKLKQYFQWAND